IQLSGTGNGAAINTLLQTGSQLLIEDSEFIQCKGSSDGGAIYLNIQHEGQATISNSSFNQCEAYFGGGISAYINSNGKFLINGTQFTNCGAQTLGGGLEAWLYPENSILELISLTFEKCTSGSQGGGLFVSLTGASLIMPETCLFKNCKCNNNGGGFNIQCTEEESQIQTTVDINQMEFKNCSADFGGGIFMNVNDGGQLSITGQTSFKNCESNYYGGGCYIVIYGGNVNFSSTDWNIFDNCQTQNGGGGMAADFYSKKSILELINIIFKNSKCNYDYCYGGGIFLRCNEPGNQILMNGQIQFENCSSSYLGGGICITIFNNSTVEINNTSFKDCSAEYGGGLEGLVSDGGQLSITGQTSFQNCESNFYGGGCYLSIIDNGRINISSTDQILFDNCSAYYQGGGIVVIVYGGRNLSISSSILFYNCKSNIDDNGFGGGIYAQFNGSESSIQITGQIQFENCSSSYLGGGMFIRIYNQQIIEINQISFKDCCAKQGGGIDVDIDSGGQLYIKNQSIFTGCKTSQTGGGIYSKIYDGTVNIEDTTFDSCTCIQPGDGGALALIHGLSSIISITNSSFIDCKTISNPLDQRYGWGGAIFIQTSITASRLNQSNFLLANLIFIGCSAVNSIGNNIHIRSINTSATGEAIKNGNLLSVKDLSNPPNIISDLYTSVSYAYDYMGINQSIQTSNPGTINLDLHNPLFEQSFTSNVPNPTYIDSIYGKDIKFCGLLQTMCQTIKYAIDRNPTPLSGIPPPDINYSIIMTSNTELDTNIQINSTTLLTGNVIIQSDGYSPEAGNDIYIKRSISTSSFSNSLFTISETGDLSLLGLHFDNLNSSSTNALMSIRRDDNTQQANITIIDCEFNQDSSSYSSSSLSHSIISINGGQM
ncbi:MAG: hypothetical protein EZS28_033823, partial [Streblomastix strix]